jgi:putative MATE family efflux protein
VLAAVPVLIAQVGHGWLRGAQDTRTPTYIALAGLLVHVVLAYLLIYPAGAGVEGAAWATVTGETGAAVAFIVVLARRMEGARWRPHWGAARQLLTVGADLAIRTGALLAGLTFATSIAARMGDVALGSWQIAMQILLFLALSLDCVAIAAQALIGRALGAGDVTRAQEISNRLMWWGTTLGIALCAVLLPLAFPLAHLFTADAAVASTAGSLLIWVAALQPLSGAAFTLDGILIGASDTRFLAGAMAASSAAFIVLSYVALTYDLGTAGLAVAATVWMVARTATTGVRWWRGRWMLAG